MKKKKKSSSSHLCFRFLEQHCVLTLLTLVTLLGHQKRSNQRWVASGKGLPGTEFPQERRSGSDTYLILTPSQPRRSCYQVDGGAGRGQYPILHRHHQNDSTFRLMVALAICPKGDKVNRKKRSNKKPKRKQNKNKKGFRAALHVTEVQTKQNKNQKNTHKKSLWRLRETWRKHHLGVVS